MIYELRTYWIDPAVLDVYIDWVNTKAQPLQREKFGFRTIGFWRIVDEEEGEPDGPNITWMAAWESREERDRVWTEIRASAEWAQIREGMPNFHRRPPNVKFVAGLDCSALK